MTTSQLSKSEREQALELWKMACRKSFRVWFESGSKIKVKDPTKPLEIPKLNKVQREIDDAIDWCDENGVPARVVVLKARQFGVSSYAVARGYHRARSTGASCAILGDDGNTTEKLMQMWKRYGENDAMDAAKAWGNTPTNPHQPSWLTFTHGANLTLETANDPRAGQGTTLHFLHSSETASYRASGHSTGEDVFSAILGCVPELPGTLVIIESTAQGTHGAFYNTVQGAVGLADFKDGKRGNGYILIFAPWFDSDDYVFDGRDGRRSLGPGEAERILATLTDDEDRLIRQFGPEIITPERLAWRRHKISSPDCGGDIRKFKREYPSTPEEAFQGSGGQYFDPDGLLWQEQQIIPASMAAATGDIILHGGRAPQFLKRHQTQSLFRIWEHPEDGESYLLSADWCVGRQAAGAKGELDTNAFGVWRAGKLNPQTREYRLPRLVASCQPDDRSRGSESIQRVLALHRMYGDCMVVPEINNKDNIIEQLQAAGITNLWGHRQGADGARPGQGKTQEILGFLTTGTRDGGGSRKQILDNLETMVREQQFICSCPVLLHQLKVFIRNQQGRGEAPPGDHDDWVMMTAIGLFCLSSATVYTGTRGQSAASIDRYRLERSSISPLGA